MMATPTFGIVGGLVLSLALVGVLGPVPLGIMVAFAVGVPASEPPVG